MRTLALSVTALVFCEVLNAAAIGRVVIFGCDVSASVLDAEKKKGANHCDAELATVLDSIRPETDQLFIYLIDGRGLTAGAPRLSFSYRKFNPFSERDADYTRAVTNKKAQTRRALDDLLARVEPVEGTDLFGFWQNAAQILRSYPASTTRQVVLVTDGVHETTGDLNFRKTALSDGDIERLIERQRKAGTLPELKNVQAVFVTGLSVQDSRYYDSTKLLRVEATWRKWLPACGGSVRSYGPILVNFGGGQ
jgi:hypothetical protein